MLEHSDKNVISLETYNIFILRFAGTLKTDGSMFCLAIQTNIKSSN